MMKLMFEEVPTRKEVQLMLAEKELLEGISASRVAEWIATGLKLEETK